MGSFQNQKGRSNWYAALALVLSLTFCVGWLIARPTEKARIAREYMDAQAISTLFTGVVLVARGDEILFEGGYGSADIAQSVDNHIDTQFGIGSITKAFTATVVLQLQEEHLLSINDAICDHLEDCPEHWRAVTIGHLLSHTSGIFDFTHMSNYLEVTSKPATNAEVMARFRDRPLNFEPATRYEYSNSGYRLLGLIVEQVSALPFREVLSQRVLKPAGLTETGMGIDDPTARRLATGYRPDLESEFQPDPITHWTWSFTGGALHSTVHDLLRFSLALDGELLVSEATKSAMWTPGLDNWGLGWGVFDSESEINLGLDVVMTSGRTPGYTACFMKFPKESVTAIVLSNNVNADTCPIARDLSAIALDRSVTMPVARREVYVDPKILERYVGEYDLDGGRFSIVFENGYLVAEAETTSDAFQLIPESDTDFFLKTFDTQVKFSGPGDGHADRVTFSVRGRRFVARRVSD